MSYSRSCSRGHGEAKAVRIQLVEKRIHLIAAIVMALAYRRVWPCAGGMAAASSLLSARNPEALVSAVASGFLYRKWRGMSARQRYRRRHQSMHEILAASLNDENMRGTSISAGAAGQHHLSNMAAIWPRRRRQRAA